MTTGYETDLLECLKIIALAQARQAKALEKLASVVKFDQFGEPYMKIWKRDTNV